MRTVTSISHNNPDVQKPVLLYFYLSNSSFVIQDIDSLQTVFKVKLFLFPAQI